MLIQNLLVMLMCFICACTDLKWGKIYNRVVYTGALAGVALSFMGGAGSGVAAISGLLVGLLLYTALYWFKAVAAGDVKLMAAIGAFKGAAFVISCSFYTLCFACVFGLFVLAWKGRLIMTLRWIGGSVISFILPGVQRPALEAGTTMPFAPSIFLGATLTIWLDPTNGLFIVL